MQTTAGTYSTVITPWSALRWRNPIECRILPANAAGGKQNPFPPGCRAWKRHCENIFNGNYENVKTLNDTAKKQNTDEVELLEKLVSFEEKIIKDTDRDYFLSAEESKEYGLIDHVISKRSVLN